MKGKAHIFGNNINTDYIITGKYKFKSIDMKELSTHLMEDIRPDFYKEIETGRLHRGRGRTSAWARSREQAPLVIQAAGISAVLAKSFARIFYRNCINVGLPVIECDTSQIAEGDELSVDLEKRDRHQPDHRPAHQGDAVAAGHGEDPQRGRTGRALPEARRIQPGLKNFQ